MSQHIGEIDPGWYPDPRGEPQERYWDGHHWTERTRPMVIAIPPHPSRSPESDEGSRGD